MLCSAWRFLNKAGVSRVGLVLQEHSAWAMEFRVERVIGRSMSWDYTRTVVSQW